MSATAHSLFCYLKFRRLYFFGNWVFMYFAVLTDP